MSNSFLDHLPSQEREKIRKRMRSPEEYERLREKVKGPEDLEREMKKSEQMAEANFRLETEPETAERLQNAIADDINERGVEGVLEGEIPEDVQRVLEQGNFTVSVEAHPQTHEDTLVVIPEGNIQDKMPVKPILSEGYVQSLLSA